MLTRRTNPSSIVLVAALLLSIAGAAPADTVTLRGSSIPIRGCRIQAVRSGELFYLDAGNRRQRRSLEDVRSLGFDGLPALDEAERRIDAGDLDGGLLHLLQANLAAETRLQRVWTHARLAQLHDARGEFVPAARHAVAVWRLDQDPTWRRLAPLCEPDPDPDVVRGFAAALEAREAIRLARRSIRNAVLLELVDELDEVIAPLHDRLSRDYVGPPLSADSTLSGVPRQLIADGRLGAAAPPRARRAGRDAPPLGGADGAADEIDRLLAAGRAPEALEACRLAAARPGQRSVPRLLHQYGLALCAAGRDRDAAVMFLRCAILYPASPHTPPSLMEAARIHRETFADVAAARRLLEEALERAEEIDRAAFADEARRRLDALPEAAP